MSTQEVETGEFAKIGVVLVCIASSSLGAVDPASKIDGQTDRLIV